MDLFKRFGVIAAAGDRHLAEFCEGKWYLEIPAPIYPLVARVCGQQERLSECLEKRDVEGIFQVFSNDPLVICSLNDAKKLFDEMCRNTAKYLMSYNL